MKMDLALKAMMMISCKKDCLDSDSLSKVNTCLLSLQPFLPPLFHGCQLSFGMRLFELHPSLISLVESPLHKVMCSVVTIISPYNATVIINRKDM